MRFDVENVCNTSEDSMMDLAGYAFLQQSKGHFWYSTATAESTMDFSKTGEDDAVVESSPIRCPIEFTSTSASPPWSIGDPASPSCSVGANVRTSQRLYGEELPTLDSDRKEVCLWLRTF